jgi:hypothetical protein
MNNMTMNEMVQTVKGLYPHFAIVLECKMENYKLKL